MRQFERMLPTKKTYNYKMATNASKRLLYSAYMVLLILIAGVVAENRHTPARVLAKQTGATQFEEERFDTHADCNEHKHHLKKRASDEDVDYEVYQGVVGRPGIDFPIYPRIPRTAFSCKSFGNGYFADMETDCQVFHICEDGRKISFLCPNGTIFQQSELTCDWWFKVNCLGSSGYYAESSEILNKQRVQRIRPSVPVQGFNIVGGGLNIKPKVPSKSQPRSKQNGRHPDRRIDSNEAPSVETVDFDDISGEKQLKIPQNKIVNSIDNNDESQVASESGSLAEAARKHNNLQHERDHKRKESSGRGSYTSESTEYARQGKRGQQRYRDDGKKQSSEADRNISEESREHKTLALPEKILKPIVALDEQSNAAVTQATTSTTYNSGAYSKSSSYNSGAYQTSTTFNSGAYTTARRSDGSRSTPYYTPTVPPVNKQKTTQGKNAYVKGNLSVGAVATTQNPNRLNGASGWGVNKENDSKSTPNYTVKPIVIGMRHHTESSHSNEYIPTGSPRTTAPTYLPRSGSIPQTERSSAGESLLFAPNPTGDESVHRNLDEMLKVMNNINNKIENAKKDNFYSRSGQATPASASSDLLPLSQYYAGENANSLYGSGGQKPSKNNYKYSAPSTSETTKLSQKTSDTTFSATTASSVKVDAKADDINASLLSPKTVNKYTDLFGIQKSNLKSERLNAASTSQKEDDANAATFPQIGSTDATISKLAEKPESRSIAQVFSNALTTYLEDPVVFRQQLVSVRPTEPPAVTKENFVTVSSTDSSLFNQGTAASYLPTIPTTLPDFPTTQSSIAVEINNKFEQSTPSYVDISSTTEVVDVVTSAESKASSERKKNKLELSAELYSHSNESDEPDEILRKEQSSSFVTPRNKAALTKTSSPFSTEKPWKVSEHDFLDPLTINDGLMKSTKTTASPITYISVGTTSRSSKATAKQIRPLARLEEEPSSKKNKLTNVHAQGSDDSWHEIFNRYEIPADTLPSNSGLQRIANKLFGGLNETEALHLKNVMQQAEHNRQVLSLLLLLIQTCDDTNGRALERSRKHLLNALIDMDTKLQNEHNGKQAYVKSKPTQSVPATTFRTSYNDLQSTTIRPQTTTYISDQATTTLASSVEETTKFEIRVEDPDEEFGHRGTEKPFTTTADKRALELLKSLYSLASKFTSRR